MKKFTLIFTLLAFVAANVFSQTLSTDPPLVSGSVNICVDGGVTTSILSSENGVTYNLVQTNPPLGLVDQAIGDGGTVSFNTISYGSTGTISYSVQRLNFSVVGSYTVTVITQPVAPTMTKDPNTDVCSGTDVKAAVATNGSGGVSGSNDKFEYSTDGGANWNSYTPGNNISTTGLSGTNIVQVRAWRADDEGRGCISGYNYLNWTVNALPVPGINGESDVCAGSSATYTTEAGMTSYTWSVSGGTGTSTTNSITVTWGTAGTGSVSVSYTDGNGCTAASATVLNVTKSDAPSVTAVSLQSTLNQSDYQDLTGSLGTGYSMYLYACEDYTYLDVDNFSATVDILADFLHPFTLNQTGLTQDWWDYWTAKNVTAAYATAYPASWQAFMWNIIKGDEPIFYLKKTGSDYQLIDGFQYQFGQGEQMLRISGDYPLATYTYDGELYATAGCFSTLSMDMTFERGLLNLTQQKTYGTIQGAITAASDNDVIEVCAGTYTENIIFGKNGAAGKNLSIHGGDPNNRPVIQGYLGSPGVSGVGSEWTDVSIKNLKFERDGYLVYWSIGHGSGITLDNVLFENVEFYQKGEWAGGGHPIWTHGLSATTIALGGLTFDDCTFKSDGASTPNFFRANLAGTGKLTIKDSDMSMTRYTSVMNLDASQGSGPEIDLIDNDFSGVYVLLSRQSEVNITGNTFDNAKLILNAPVNTTVEDNTFKNLDDLYGAVNIWNTYGASPTQKVENVSIIDNDFTYNVDIPALIVQSFDHPTAPWIDVEFKGNNLENVTSPAVDVKIDAVVLDATGNWWGTILYTEIYDMVNGKVVFVPYCLDAACVTSGGGPAIPANLALTYTEASENILVVFDVTANELELQPVPGLGSK
jgi:hypothetical protein